ncbi:MAG: hypothetical protein UU21_C0020G0016 [Candidatus Levybacteria bacterium GW2011_GWA2_40_8]|nr:MAG: hypothetical protein UU21_C0020G0016 [Candidatus Levybacteria bacterium GW2011_GWA2_40_8]
MTRPAGFTLIEILVTVVISGILFGGGIAAYRGIGDKQAVKQNGATFLSNLRAFQQKALASEKPADCGANKLESFKVSYVNVSSYSVKASCVGTATTITLTDEVEFTAGFNDIDFQVLKAEVLNGGIEEEQTITLQKGSTSYQVTIEQRGVISGKLL